MAIIAGAVAAGSWLVANADKLKGIGKAAGSVADAVGSVFGKRDKKPTYGGTTKEKTDSQSSVAKAIQDLHDRLGDGVTVNPEKLRFTSKATGKEVENLLKGSSVSEMVKLRRTSTKVGDAISGFGEKVQEAKKDVKSINDSVGSFFETVSDSFKTPEQVAAENAGVKSASAAASISSFIAGNWIYLAIAGVIAFFDPFSWFKKKPVRRRTTGRRLTKAESLAKARAAKARRARAAKRK